MGGKEKEKSYGRRKNIKTQKIRRRRIKKQRYIYITYIPHEVFFFPFVVHVAAIGFFFLGMKKIGRGVTHHLLSLTKKIHPKKKTTQKIIVNHNNIPSCTVGVQATALTANARAATACVLNIICVSTTKRK